MKKKVDVLSLLCSCLISLEITPLVVYLVGCAEKWLLTSEIGHTLHITQVSTYIQWSFNPGLRSNTASENMTRARHSGRVLTCQRWASWQICITWVDAKKQWFQKTKLVPSFRELWCISWTQNAVTICGTAMYGMFCLSVIKHVMFTCIQYIVIIFYMYIKHYAWYTIIIDVKKNLQ